MMNRITLFILGIIIAATLFASSPVMGQSNDPLVVNAQHQVPVIVSLELPTGITNTTSVQFTLLLDIESTTALMGSEAISANVDISATVISEVLAISVEIGSSLDSRATVVLPIPTTVPPTITVPGSPVIVIQNSNLRACPNISCDIVGIAQIGQKLEVVGQNADGEWYQLVSGEWIAAFLVDNAPDSIPVVTSTPVVAETPIPTKVPILSAPSIEFTFVPAYGSYEDLQGQIRGAESEKYNIAAYIYVSGSGWWTKPSFDSPLTPTRSDGYWITDITTGGEDHLATQIAAFLVPDGYDPPLMSGEQALPKELFDNAVVYIIKERANTKPPNTPMPSHTSASPPSSSWITVRAAGGEASGEVGPPSVCNSDYKVALYAMTDMWYVQPFTARRNIKINDDCTWNSSTHPWKQIVAFLVPADYNHPSTILELSCPPLDPATDSNILATACFP